MRYRFTLVRIAIITNSTNKCRWCGEKRTLVHCSWECRLMQPLWKTVWNFLRKLKLELPFDSAIPLLGLYPKNPETSIQKNLCAPMFTAAQFTIAKCWKQQWEFLRSHCQYSSSQSSWHSTFIKYLTFNLRNLISFLHLNSFMNTTLIIKINTF